MTTTTVLSITEQRKIEREQRKLAQDKRRKQLIDAMNRGSFGDTAVGSRMINNGLVKELSVILGTKGKGEILTGKIAAKLSAEIKKSLEILFIDANEGKDKEPEYQIASGIIYKSLKAILNGATCLSGEVIAEGDDVTIYEGQTTQKVFEAIADVIEFEVKMASLMDAESVNHNPDAYFACKRISNEPAFSPELETVAHQAILKGVDVSEALTLWKQWKSDKSDSPFTLKPTDKAMVWVDWTNEERFAIAQVVFSIIDKNTISSEHRFWDINDVFLGTITDRRKYFCLRDVDAFHQQTEAFIESALDKSVMYTAPIEWSDDTLGGQILNDEQGNHPFVRGGSDQTKVSKLIYDAVNNVQSVPYVINSYILNVAHAATDVLVKGSHKVGSFIAPVKGVHISKCLRTKAAITAADNAIAQGGSFWSYWNVDYRGRMYAINTTLHVQSTDFEKSLLKVADAQPINDRTIYWLSIHLANTFGKDKLTFDGRVEWVNDHLEIIKSVAAEPLKWIQIWANDSTADAFMPDKPWQFLAACEEYVALFVDKSRTTTSLLVATDCTCSGIQVLSGIIKDAESARLVNVAPSDLPQDAYGAVANRAAEYLRGEKVLTVKSGKNSKAVDVDGLGDYASLLDRKVCKKVVMTMPYNSTASAHAGYIKEQLRGKDLPEDLDTRKRLLNVIGKAIRQAMSDLMPQVSEFQDWINECAANYADANKAVEWTTPSGFTVHQVKNKIETVILKTSFGGKRGQIELAVKVTDKVLANKHSTCTMPNFVHSLDASLLHIAFAGFDKPFALIHDSVMTTASDMDAAISAYKESYVEHFGSESVVFSNLVEMFDSMHEKTVVPTPGNLVVEEVENSTYFLS